MLENLKNVMPPSPNSSAFAKYGDWPVSLYTGVPNISVPVTTLKGRTTSVAITLSYHAAGNKVGDIASWVGLGWSLNTGGVITRSVRGLKDEEGLFNSSYYYDNPNDLSSNAPDNIKQLRLVQTADNDIDSEPDLYYFNALGKSFKLLILADGTVNTIPYSNLKFVSNPIVNGINWTVLLEDGTKLVFGDGIGFVEGTHVPSFKSKNGSSMLYNSSWHLKSITSTNGEIVNFTYASCDIDQDSYFSESDFIKYKTTGGSTCTEISHSSSVKASPSIQKVKSLNISTIETDLERAEFFSLPGREDLEGGYSLNEIKIYSKITNQYTQRYLFNFSYSQAVVTPKFSGGGLINSSFFDKRLRLNSFERIDVANASAPSQKWVFDYNPQNLPSRRSYAQDHWGFYNGANSNTTLLPRLYFQLPPTFASQYLNFTGFMPDRHPLGGNRDGNGAMMQAEILTGIQYPTGGYSQFNYEPNSIPVSKETFTDTYLPLELNVTSVFDPLNNQDGTSTFRTAVFTVTKPCYVQMALTSDISPGIILDQPNVQVGVAIFDVNNNTIVSSTTSGWYNLRQAGTYTMRIRVNTRSSNLAPNDLIYSSVTLFYPKSNGLQSYDELTGGLRIRSIIDTDGSSSAPVNYKYYQYSNPLVINDIDEKEDYSTLQSSSSYSDIGTIVICYFNSIIRNSSTKYALGSIQGGTTGYGQVTTIYGSAGENGKTVSTFSNVPDDSDICDPHIFPYPPSVSNDIQRGLLLNQKDYSAQSILLKEMTNTYSFYDVSVFIGYKAGYYEIVDPHLCNNVYHNCGILQANYPVISQQIKQNSIAQTIYDSNGQNPLTTTTTNFYDNALNTQPVRTVTVNSEGQTLTTYSRTALEKADINTAAPLSTTASTAIDKMLEMNMVNQVLQQRKEINAALENQATVNHKIWYAGGGGNPTIVAPENVLVQVGSNAPETRIQFTNYDAKGNLLEQTKTNDARKSYIYNYNFSFPIAEATNADFASIAYTSFEADGLGNWAITGGKDPSMAFTGSSSGWLTGGNTVSKAGLDATKSYTVSFWIKNGTNPLVNGLAATVGKTSNGWTYYQRTLSGASTVTISGTGNIDEVRLFPQGALMTTYTYNAYGVSSSSTPSGLATFYEYDSFGRLAVVRDDENKILKMYQYNYKTQP